MAGVDAHLVYRSHGGSVRHDEYFMSAGLYFLDKKKIKFIEGSYLLD